MAAVLLLGSCDRSQFVTDQQTYFAAALLAGDAPLFFAARRAAAKGPMASLKFAPAMERGTHVAVILTASPVEALLRSFPLADHTRSQVHNHH